MMTTRRCFFLSPLPIPTHQTLHNAQEAPAWMPRRAWRTSLAFAATYLSLVVVQAAAFVCPPPPAFLPPHLRPISLTTPTRFLPPSTSTSSIATSMASSSMNSQADQQHVVATLHGNRVLELTLTRPKALNALSSQMLLDLTKHVQRALANEKDDNGSQVIEAVLLTAVEGSRAFSAGGDIKEIMNKLLSEKEKTEEEKGTVQQQGCNPLEYITIEYQLDSLLHKLSTLKPVIALCDGIVMGGGAGIYQAAGIRVVTPISTFAMPECRIALLPDAMAMGFLFRAPGEVPLYCALTGARLGGECMKAVGLATHVVGTGEEMRELGRVLRVMPVGDFEEALKGAEERRRGGRRGEMTPIEARRPLIDALFKHNTVREIHTAMLQERQRQKQERNNAETSSSQVKEREEGSEWLDTALAALEAECPVSHVVTLHAIRTAQHRARSSSWDIDQGLGIEFVANRCLGFRPDFVEGVSTAVGARKGETPQWTHASWEAVGEDVEVQQLLARMTQAKSVWDEIGR